MKKNVLTLAFLSIALFSYAQHSAEAKKILDKAYNAYENSRGIKISFRLTVSESNGSTDQPQRGTAIIKGNKFKIEMPAVDTWFDGQTQWVLMKDVNEVNISHPSTDEIASISPLALLGMYKTGYTLKAPVPGTINGISTYVIHMVPVADKSDFRDVSVAIDKKSNSVVQVNLTMKNGMRSKIDISDYNANYNFPDSEFVFNQADHQGVEVVDLR